MPLCDLVRPRLLIVTLIILTAAGLVGAGAAPDPPGPAVAGTAVGITTVVPQILLPMSAALVPDRRRGAVTGTLLSACSAASCWPGRSPGALGGWVYSAPYLVAAALMLVLAVVLALVLPAAPPPSNEHYGALLAAPVRLMLAEPYLRRRACTRR